MEERRSGKHVISGLVRCSGKYCLLQPGRNGDTAAFGKSTQLKFTTTLLLLMLKQHAAYT